MGDQGQENQGRVNQGQENQGRVNQEDTPFIDAMLDGDYELAHYLASNPRVAVEEDGTGRTPLHYLARDVVESNFQFFRILVLILLNNGANVNQVDEQGDSPLHTAIYNGNLLMAMLLLRHGANPRLFPDTDETYPVLYTLMAYMFPTRELRRLQAALAIWLYQRFGYEFGLNDDGWSLLQAASEGGNSVIVQFLLNQGADPNIETIEGDRPLETARLRGNTRVVNMLIAAGAVEREEN